MDHSTTFARHFARLVHLLLHEPKNIANQKAALRLLVAMAKEGQVTLAIRDWQVVANGALLPPQLEGVEGLAAQLIGHAISELVAEKDASAADLLGIARTLATEPVPGDGGRSVADKLAALGAKTVRVTLSGNAPLPRVATVSLPTHGSDVAAPITPAPKAATNGGSRNTGDMAVVAEAPAPPPAPATAPPRRASTGLRVMHGLTDSYISQFAVPGSSQGSISDALAQ